MASINSKALVVLLIIGMAAIPALGNSSGPPYLNQDGDLTVKYGCSCHNNGATSERAVVMITSVPIMYDLDESYQLTIKVADSLTLSGGDGNTKGGFLLSSENLGTFTWTEDEDIRIAADSDGDISHSETDSDGIWIVTWTAPSEDVGTINFWLVGNSVDGGGVPDTEDYWNLLAFSVSPPGTISEEESGAILSTRTISVGDYDSLFLLEETDAQKEAKRQEAIANRIYEQGNLFYWFSLTALIVGAVVQREVLERKYDEGPEHLALELAYPQAIRQAVVSVISFGIAVRWLAEDSVLEFPPRALLDPEAQNVTDLTSFVIGFTFLFSAWFAYAVYRTVLAARAKPKVKDLL
ncbi:hypothetical protein OAN05_00020 [bacterium]|nr:hypothetical protein [bacterium]